MWDTFFLQQFQYHVQLLLQSVLHWLSMKETYNFFHVLTYLNILSSLYIKMIYRYIKMIYRHFQFFGLKFSKVKQRMTKIITKQRSSGWYHFPLDKAIVIVSAIILTFLNFIHSILRYIKHVMILKHYNTIVIHRCVTRKFSWQWRFHFIMAVV